MLRKLSCMTAMMLMLSHGVALAQDAVNARIAPHGGSARVVFSWPSAVTYTANRSGDRLEITFARPGNLQAPSGTDPNVVGVQQVAGGGEPLKVVLSAAPGREFRHFAAGSRVIVDVIDSAAPKAQAAPTPQSAPERAQPPAKTETKATAVAPAPSSVAPAMPAKTVAAVKEENIPQGKIAPDPADTVPALPPHTISVTTTENIGLAAFERFGTLWIVVDRPGFTVPPQVTGPEKDKFPAFQRADLADATIFRVPLPDGAEHVYGEGGGLVWRVVVTPGARHTSPVLPERTFEKQSAAGSAERGGTVKWPLRRVTKLVEITDPAIGDTITVATVADSAQNTGSRREFVDFTTLESPIGLAIRAKVDDLKIEKLPDGIKVTRPGGLALSQVKDMKAQKIREDIQETASQVPAPTADGMKRLFDFDRWMMGGLESLSENQHILLGGMGGKDKNGRVQDLLALAKMNIANDRGPEAIGFLSFAAQELPPIADSPEFRALRGAAEALSGKYELAWRDLNDPVLAGYDELSYWRAYTLAWLEDWQQAGQVMPQDHKVLLSYPRPLLEKMGIKLAELSLRKNEVPKAENILATLERQRSTLKPWTVAALDYLTGQAARQKGEVEKTRPLWEPLITGKDDFYRARAGLALTMLELESKNINLDQAIDRLEGLRYAWRGDELESQINFTLGKLYIEKDDYMKGFTILREAADMNKGSDISAEIKRYMGEAFMDLLLNNADLSAEDAVMVYEEFKDLTPDTPEGHKLVEKLAERMVDADLLTRAGAILQHQVDFEVAGAEQARVAMRLAAIYLLDHDPRLAIGALDKAKTWYAAQTDEASQATLRAGEMMRARALSQMNQTEEAIALLNGFPPAPDINRLRADIAWQAGLWEDAAEALEDLILDQGIDGQRPLLADQADLILNRAVALNLSGNRVALTNMQKRYSAAMEKTPRARLFDIVSRPRKASVMADRQTIEQIVAEVDLFKGFLEEYKAAEQPGTN